jgi:ADP-ribose pyrophosphatase YjhB (NUDIX family)
MQEQETQQLLNALDKIDPTKPYGTILFNALARVTISIGVEAVCLRRGSATHEIEVYMTQRSHDDPAYPGEWHCPGSIMRPGEEFDDVFSRLSQTEFDEVVEPVRFVTIVNNPTEQRGHFLSLVYLCNFKYTNGQSQKGAWFQVKHLPSNTVTHHYAWIIPLAVEAFSAGKASVSS